MFKKLVLINNFNMKFHGSLDQIKLFKKFTYLRFINFHILPLVINENNYINLRILLLQ